MVEIISNTGTLIAKPTPRLLKLCDELEATCDKLRMNANVRLTLTAFAVNTGLLQ